MPQTRKQPRTAHESPRSGGLTESLRGGAIAAVLALGRGFLGHPANAGLRSQLRSGSLSARDYSAQLIRVVYRLLVTFIVDDRARGSIGRPGDPGFGDRLRLLAARGGQPVSRDELWDLLSDELNPANLTERGADSPTRPGGFLRSDASTPNLLGRSRASRHSAVAVDLADADLLDAVRALAIAPRARGGDRVDFGGIGYEALGAVYESLLAMDARIDLDTDERSARFTLMVAPGNRRKSSGSYYTPAALVQSLLDSALDPVIDEAIRGRSGTAAEAAILGLRVCDPACGAGNFLIPAAHRLAAALARVRGQGNDEARCRAGALREIIDGCIYGVDVDPMAAELCRIGLQLELPESESLSDPLGLHVKCGNSVLGATAELLSGGIPDEAFEPLAGDDARVVKYYRKRNRQERRRVDDGRPAADPHGGPGPRSGAEHARLIADAWCAAFAWRKHDTDRPGAVAGCPGRWDAITEAVFRKLAREPRSVPSWLVEEIRRIAGIHCFFHWHIEFPEIFERGGFDVVLGNPPFLNQLETATTTARGLAAIAGKQSGGLIRAYTDLSATFLLLGTRIVRPGGRVALVQPQAVLAVNDAAPVREAVLRAGALESLWVSNAHVFDGASVFTCAATVRIGGPRETLLRRTMGATFEHLPDLPLNNDALAREETWGHLVAAAAGIPELSFDWPATLGSIAEATADFRDQYYGLEGFLVEDAALDDAERADLVAFPPIVTTGLIDLAENRWGRQTTRILKAKWSAPRIDRRRMEIGGTLGAWMAARLTPKVLLATQTRVIEVFVDASGRFVPSTPLITVTPRQPDRLWHIAAAIASPVCTALAMQKYAGAAMTADAIKLSARQVLRMPVPSDLAAWDLGAESLRRAHGSSAPSERRGQLLVFGARMCEAYGVPEASAQAVLDWWRKRLGDAALRDGGPEKPDSSRPSVARLSAARRDGRALIEATHSR